MSQYVFYFENADRLRFDRYPDRLSRSCASALTRLSRPSYCAAKRLIAMASTAQLRVSLKFR
jgi:hypothetical protein